MEKKFIQLSEIIINDLGKNILHDSKLTKALFMDYGGSDYRNEINLLIMTIELGNSIKLAASDNLVWKKLKSIYINNRQ